MTTLLVHPLTGTGRRRGCPCGSSRKLRSGVSRTLILHLRVVDSAVHNPQCNLTVDYGPAWGRSSAAISHGVSSLTGSGLRGGGSTMGCGGGGIGAGGGVGTGSSGGVSSTGLLRAGVAGFDCRLFGLGEFLCLFGLSRLLRALLRRLWIVLVCRARPARRARPSAPAYPAAHPRVDPAGHRARRRAENPVRRVRLRRRATRRRAHRVRASWASPEWRPQAGAVPGADGQVSAIGRVPARRGKRARRGRRAEPGRRGLPGSAIPAGALLAPADGLPLATATRLRRRRSEITRHLEHCGGLGCQHAGYAVEGSGDCRHRLLHRGQPFRPNVVVHERFHLLVDQLAGHRTITRSRRHRMRRGQPVGHARRGVSTATAAATFPSTVRHRSSRNAASGVDSVRTADGRSRRFAVAEKEIV